MKMIQIQFGEYGPMIASPFIADDIVAQLLRTPFYHQQYARGPNGEYGNVFLRAPVIVRCGEPAVPVFDGTETEYRNQPAPELTRADLVAQLSASQDTIAALEETIRALNSRIENSEPVDAPAND